MDEAVRARISQDAAEMNIHHLVYELVRNVGPTVVQTMAGTADRTSPQSWARPDGQHPSPEMEARLRLGYRAWKTVETAEGRNVALAWLVGADPRLGGELPVLCIQQQDREVLGSAEAVSAPAPRGD